MEDEAASIRVTLSSPPFATQIAPSPNASAAGRSPTEIGVPTGPAENVEGLNRYTFCSPPLATQSEPAAYTIPVGLLTGQSLVEHPGRDGIDACERRPAVDRPDRAAAHRHLAREGGQGDVDRLRQQAGSRIDPRKPVPARRVRPTPPLRRPRARSASGCSARRRRRSHACAVSTRVSVPVGDVPDPDRALAGGDRAGPDADRHLGDDLVRLRVDDADVVRMDDATAPAPSRA